MKKYLRYLGPVFIAAIFCLAVFLLHNKLKQYSIAQIQESVAQVDSWRIVVCLLCTALSYWILVGYDWLAIRAIHKKLALSRVVLVSFIGQTVSYNFGALLGGTTVRYRFYSAWDFTISDIVRLVLMLAVTFWIGVLGLCGIFFVVAPPHIPEELLEHLPFVNLRLLGVVLFLVALLYMVLCFTVRHPVHVFGKEFVFPGPRLAVAQLVVAGVDILAAAFCMYILLPEHLGIGFWDFVPGYLLAQVAVVLTHVPGGVGIFELIIIHLTQTDQVQVVFASVLLFRLLYYILPLLLAVAVFFCYEIRVRSNGIAYAKRWFRIKASALLSYAVFAFGALLLFSSLLGWQAGAFGYYLTLFSGLALLFIAQGLSRRRLSGRRGAYIALVCAALSAYLSGVWPLSLLALLLLLCIVLARRRFYRSASLFEDRVPFTWNGAALLIAGIFVVVSFMLTSGGWSWSTFLGATEDLAACRAMRSVFCLCGLFLCGGMLLRSRRSA
ncbi:MAG: lysylphosphatidylglycerol synthetase family protein [Desulfovibrionaceae bacterium]|nr:lysylphosphatidylglycerol synthetase family protein [Desulfovibrionaceae bacterium]